MKSSLASYFFAVVRELSGQCHSLVPAISLLSLKSIESVNDVRGPSVVDVRRNGPGCLSRIRKDLKRLGTGMALLIQSETLAAAAVVKRLCVLLNVADAILFQLWFESALALGDRNG